MRRVHVAHTDHNEYPQERTLSQLQQDALDAQIEARHAEEKRRNSVEPLSEQLPIGSHLEDEVQVEEEEE